MTLPQAPPLTSWSRPGIPALGGSWFSCLLGEVLDTSVDTHALPLRARASGHLPCLLTPTHSPVNIEPSDSSLKLAGGQEGAGI